MSKDGRIYAVIKWTPAMDKNAFLLAKQQGVIESDLSTIRKSLDGKKAILKYRGVEPAKLQGLILWAGTLDKMHEYLRENAAEWEAPEPLARVSVMARGIRAVAVPVKAAAIQAKKVPWWAWAAGAGAALGYYLINFD